MLPLQRAPICKGNEPVFNRLWLRTTSVTLSALRTLARCELNTQNKHLHVSLEAAFSDVDMDLTLESQSE